MLTFPDGSGAFGKLSWKSRTNFSALSSVSWMSTPRTTTPRLAGVARPQRRRPGRRRCGRATPASRGVVVLGVDIQDTDDKALKFVRDFQLSFPNAPDPAGKVSIDYGIYGVPETFFIDKQGRIRAKHVGSLTEDVFRKHVERLTAEG